MGGEFTPMMRHDQNFFLLSFLISTPEREINGSSFGIPVTSIHLLFSFSAKLSKTLQHRDGLETENLQKPLEAA